MFLAGAHAAAPAGEAARLLEMDTLAEAATLPAELRSGSVRAGAALLGVHEKLGTPGASQYRALVREEKTFGHLAVAQGLCFAGAGLDLVSAETVSVHALLTGLAGAAIRLGLVGHVDTQNAIAGLHGKIGTLLQTPAPLPEDAWNYTPVADIAVMRHETHDSRLFAN